LVRAASERRVQKCQGARRHSFGGLQADESTEINEMKMHTVSDFYCPVCRNSRVSRAEFAGIVEQTILRIFQICPFVCQACYTRFYMFVATSSFRRLEPLQPWHDSEQNESISSLS